MTLLLTMLALAGLLDDGSRLGVPAGVPEDEWQRIVESAGESERPILLISAGKACRSDRCRGIRGLIEHPAVVRRARRIEVSLVDAEVDTGSVAVFFPDGVPAASWNGVPDAAGLRDILNVVNGASPRLVEAFRARRDGDFPAKLRAEALAMFSLGRELEGRQRLQQLQVAGSEADRELANIWLARLASRKIRPSAVAKEILDLGENGSSPHVRYEAWMLIGESRVRERRLDEAADAFRFALVASAGNAEWAAIARQSLQDVLDETRPVIGLGSPTSLVAGHRWLQPRVTIPARSSVEYRLDGEVVATAITPPHLALVNFDRVPRVQVLEVVARDPDGDEIRTWSTLINERNRFEVRIDAVPRASESGLGVDVTVEVPQGRVVERVTLELDGRIIARLQAPPFRATLDTSAESAIITATARLDDGSESDDVLVVNADETILDAAVHLAEVPVYVAGDFLTPGSVELIENGKPRPVTRIISAAESDLAVTIVLDVSASLRDHILDVEEAAIRFVNSLGEHDQIAVVAFDDSARVALWPTSDKRLAEQAIASLRTGDATALHDAMINALMQGYPGGHRRALIVLTDGVDNSSEFEMSDVVEVARRVGIPIHVINVAPRAGKLPSRNSMPVRSPVVEAQQRLERLSRETGGRQCSLWSMSRLDSCWSGIADDLNRQFIIVYRPAESGPVWRSIRVTAAGSRLRSPEGIAVGQR